MDVEIAMTAWTNNRARLGYLDATLRAITEYLPSDIPIFVCSEELDGEYRYQFELIAGSYGSSIHYHDPPAEIGSNHNFLLAKCTAEFVLFTEDDCLLAQPFDLQSDVEFLRTNPDYVMVRYVLGHSTTCADLGNGLFEVDQHSPYLYSNRCHLRHRERFASLGPFSENVGWGGQELDMGAAILKSTYRVAARIPPLFGHIGHFASQPDRWPEGETP